MVSQFKVRNILASNKIIFNKYAIDISKAWTLSNGQYFEMIYCLLPSCRKCGELKIYIS
jgi:hypothetical protein